MDRKEFTRAIDQLDLNQTSASKLLGVSDRSVRNWVAGTHEIPKSVQIVLRLMAWQNLSAEKVETICSEPIP